MNILKELEKIDCTIYNASFDSRGYEYIKDVWVALEDIKLLEGNPEELEVVSCL